MWRRFSDHLNGCAITANDALRGTIKSLPMTPSHDQMANAIRALAMDAVQKAGSGHPGMPMGFADVATVLFTRHLKFNSDKPLWPDRDRFVLSAGHGSMLLYSALYLLGYAKMPMEEIKNFRQLGGAAAGHPECDPAAGIEMTTGPLGQGLATAVGMAMAERLLAARHGDDLVDHYTFVAAGDGDLMEGVSHEAISLAGHLKLAKLIVLFDDNHISIDGPLNLSESGDAIGRFEAAGWAAERVDGHDADAIDAAIARAKSSDKPSLIACRTTIGYGAPNKQGTAASHGAPLGEDEIAAARLKLGWDAAPFEIPDDILSAWRSAGQKSKSDFDAWVIRSAAMSSKDRGEFERTLSGALPEGLTPALEDYRQRLAEETPGWASRKASQEVLEVITRAIPETIGGSADLTGSNNTRSSVQSAVTGEDFSGRFIHYGIREFGMAAAMNGMALHGGVIPYSGTFLVFADYCRPAMRLSALMKQRVIYVMTHDSIGLGEDGPTHQPVEHLASLRAIPGLNVFRPADAMETAECWQLALEAKDAPSVMALTRQGLPALRTTYTPDNPCRRGAYELLPATGAARVTLLATGSEVSIAVKARDILQADGIGARVVSMPCWELFEAQSLDYQAETLGANQIRIGIEAACQMGWDRFIGPQGAFIGMTGFGASAPAGELYEHFSITPHAAAAAARARL